MAITININIFWDMTPCRLPPSYGKNSDAQISQKSISHFKILGTSRVTYSKFHT